MTEAQRAPEALAFKITVSWDTVNERPQVDIPAALVEVGPPVPIMWEAHPSVASIDLIQFNHKGDNPNGEFSTPVGGPKTWICADKASKAGDFYYMVTATKAEEGPGNGPTKTLDPMIKNQ